MNKNQKIALIAGAVILAIVFLTLQLAMDPHDHPMRQSIQLKRALFGGGVVAALTFVAFMVLKEKD